MFGSPPGWAAALGHSQGESDAATAADLVIWC